MLFRRLTLLIVSFILMFTSLFMLSACDIRGGILIEHSDDFVGFEITLKEFNKTDTCKMDLQAGDVIQIEVVRQKGKMGLVVKGTLGDEPYNGSDLVTRTFTVTIAKSDEYTFSITGINASGTIKIKLVN